MLTRSGWVWEKEGLTVQDRYGGENTWRFDLKLKIFVEKLSNLVH